MSLHKNKVIRRIDGMRQQLEIKRHKVTVFKILANHIDSLGRRISPNMRMVTRQYQQSIESTKSRPITTERLKEGKFRRKIEEMKEKQQLEKNTLEIWAE